MDIMLQAKSLQPEMVSFATKASKKLQNCFYIGTFSKIITYLSSYLCLKNFPTSSKFVMKIYRSD